MKKIISLLLILIMLFSVVSCGFTDVLPEDPDINEDVGDPDKKPNGGGSSGDPSGDNQDGEEDNNEEKPNPSYPADQLDAYNMLFDPNNHVYLKLDISDSELEKIQQDYDRYSSFGSKSPIYRMADLIIRITKPSGEVMEWTIEQVGVRMKGNTSRTSFYNDHDGMYNLIHFKISFQETFDEEEYYGSDAIVWTDEAKRDERKDRTFATLEKIDVRWNRNDDTTYIREGYAYELYREFGVIAPHTTLCSLDIAEDHAGVWMLYEPVDKIFLEKNLPESALGGDLYKLGWTHEGATFTSFSSYGIEDEDKGEFYVYDLKTNKKTSTHQSLKNLINTIKSSSASKDSFESVVDMKNFIYFCAVSYIIGNPDDLRNNYNNCYIYFRADNGKMIVIPYDNDRGLGVNRWNPYGHGMTKDDPFAKYNVCGDQRSPLFLKTVCKGGYFVNEYVEALKTVDESILLTNAEFERQFNLAASIYSGDATPSKTYHNADWCKFRFDINRTCDPGESKNMSFADYISAKRETLYDAIGDLGNQDSGNTGSGSGSGSGGSDIVIPDGPGSGGEAISDCDPYIMSDLNNWSVSNNYKMTDNGDGSFTYELYSQNGFKIKVRDNNSGKWYGDESLDPNCDVWCAPDKHGNIYLDSGSYVIVFDANTSTIYISKGW